MKAYKDFFFLSFLRDHTRNMNTVHPEDCYGVYTVMFLLGNSKNKTTKKQSQVGFSSNSLEAVSRAGQGAHG